MSRKTTPELREAFLLGAVLVAYSNGVAIWAGRRGKYAEELFRRMNPLLTAAMLAFASRSEEGLPGVGLRREGLRKSLLAGLGVGAVLSGPPLLFFYRPLLLDTPLEYGPISRMTCREMLVDVFVRVPVGIALLEELAFRGLLYSALRRQLPVGWAIFGSSAAFEAWHLTVTATSASESNLKSAARLPPFLKPFVMPLAVGGGMLTTGVAGAGFAILREWSGNLAGPILAHWLVDGVMIVALWLRRSTPTVDLQANSYINLSETSAGSLV